MMVKLSVMHLRKAVAGIGVWKNVFHSMMVAMSGLPMEKIFVTSMVVPGIMVSVSSMMNVMIIQLKESQSVQGLVTVPGMARPVIFLMSEVN